jgi:aspartyl-tRNA(Asn)/glutamyl-tRNA(Gln) amidotransferase subunit C
MKISKEEVEHVAKLARLDITAAEKEAFAQQLSAILSYVDQLKGVDTTDVEPTATVLNQSNVLRDDIVRPSLTTDEALAGKTGGLFCRAENHTSTVMRDASCVMGDAAAGLSGPARCLSSRITHHTSRGE